MKRKPWFFEGVVLVAGNIVKRPPADMPGVFCGLYFVRIGMPIIGHRTYTAKPVTAMSMMLAGMP